MSKLKVSCMDTYMQTYWNRRVLFKTTLMVWKCVRGVAPAYLSDLCVPAIMHCHLRSSASAICSDWHSADSTHPDCNWTTNERSSFAVNGPATWNRLPSALWSPDLSDRQARIKVGVGPRHCTTVSHLSPSTHC